MRLLIDANLSPRIASKLRDEGHDAAHVADIGMLSAPDATILADAAASGQVIISAISTSGSFLPWPGRHGLRWSCFGPPIT